MQRRSFFASLLAFFGLSRFAVDEDEISTIHNERVSCNGCDDYWDGWTRGQGPDVAASPGTYADGVPRQIYDSHPMSGSAPDMKGRSGEVGLWTHSPSPLP